MRCLYYAFLIALLPCAAWASPEEIAVAESLTAEANSFLTSLLGPNHATVAITASGEVSHTQTSTSIMLPTGRASIVPAAPKKSAMPGYSENLLANPGLSPQGFANNLQGAAHDMGTSNTPSMIQQSQENVDTSAGFVLKHLSVSIVLDSHLRADQVEEVSRLLPVLLHMDSARGDEFSVLRANLTPAWQANAELMPPLRLEVKNFLRSRQVLAIGVIWLGAFGLLMIAGLFIYATVMRAVRTFVSELAHSRRQPEFAPPSPGLAQGQAGGPMMEILPGGIPSLSDLGSGEGAENMAPLPALGRRFDFLSARDPEEITGLLSEETAKDVALLFGTLANSNPELASILFAALPAKTQKEVSQELLNLTVTDPERLSLLENKIRNLIEFGVHGPERLGTILSRLPAQEREAVLTEITPQTPQAAEQLERSVFAFEDLGQLKEVELRRLITGVGYPDWGLALRNAPQSLVESILAQIPAGARSLVRESMDSPQSRAKILEARSRILSRVQALAASGEIALGRKGTSELI